MTLDQSPLLCSALRQSTAALNLGNRRIEALQAELRMKDAFIEQMKLKQQSLLSELGQLTRCSVTLLPMRDPVTLETGHSYERDVLERCWAVNERRCPNTRHVCLQPPVPSLVLRQVVEVLRRYRA